MAPVRKFWREPIQGYDPWANADEFRFHQDVAERVVAFFPQHCHHSKGEFAGKPFNLEPWQKKIVGHLFGWKHRQTKLRRYQNVFIYVPRKNGKTETAAGLILLLLVADGEPGAEIYCAAADAEQASIVYKEAVAMIEQDTTLRQALKDHKSYRSLEFPENRSTCRVLSAEAYTKHGYNPHAFIVDELHAQPDADLIEVLETGQGSRRQPLAIYLSTADFARQSPCNDMLERAIAIRDGKIVNPSFLPVLYMASAKDDWKDEDVWKRANPNYGVSLKPDFMRKECQKAIEQPSFENTFKRLHLNIQTEQEHRWLSMDHWKRCPSIPPEEAVLKGSQWFGGLDLSTTLDITAFVAFWPTLHYAKCKFWAPRECGKRRIEYELWAGQDWIDLTPGDVIDYDYIRTEINEMAKTYPKLADVGYDPHNSSQIVLALSNEDGLQMVEYRQTIALMSPPSKELERMVVSRELNHGGNPVLEWMASNACIAENTSGDLRPIKPGRNSPKKIDGIVALIMAIGRAQSGTFEEKKPSVYEGRGLIVL